MTNVGNTNSASLKKILIVEDDPIISKIYQSKLDRDGYNVVVASDGQEGFYKFYETKPDAVILDLMLPGMDGLQILKKFRAQKQFEGLPIIVLTNEFASELTREADAAGATEIFDKGKTSPEDVLKALGRVFFAKRGIALPPQKKVEPQPAADPSVSSPPRESDDVINGFVASRTETINRLREIIVRLIRSKDSAQQVTCLGELVRAVHLVSGAAAAAEHAQVARTCAALEAYMHELIAKPADINASAIRTICQAVDTIAASLNEAGQPGAVDESGLVLIVDDEPLSRRAAKIAMDRAHLKSICLSDPQIALQVLTENAFNLVILDVQMPVMDGFALCQKLRELPTHKTTPVIFVTTMNDFETRTKSTASGGTDFIGKPYLLMELALKGLISIRRKSAPAK